MASETASSGAMIRVRPETRDKLRSLAGDRPMTQLLDELAERELRRRKIEEFNAAYARLKQDPAAWAAHHAEQQELEGTLADGLSAQDSDEREWNESLVDAATW